MGVSYLHPQGEPNNGANRGLFGTNANVRVSVGIPGGTYWTGGWSVVGYSGNASASFNGSEFRLSGSNINYRGGEPGTAGSQSVREYFGDSYYGQKTGGMGGYIVWAYNAPAAPNAPSVSRASDGTSLTATTGGGSGRITYYNVALNGVTGWQANGYTFGSLGAHSNYDVIARAGNEDNASGNSGTTVSYGIPTAVRDYSVSRSSSVNRRISGSWNSPTYAGFSVNRYVVNRYDTVTGATTTILDANSTSFNDDNLVRGRLYNYSVYCIGNSSPGNGLVSTLNGIMAPGVPNAPGAPTLYSKIGRTLIISSAKTSSDYGNAINATTGWRIQLSTDDGLTWKGWDNSTKSFTANGTYNLLDSNSRFEYQLLAPALTYKWRTYAVNSIVDGGATPEYAVSSTGTFVGAGGKRFDGSVWQPTAISKRYDGTQWVDFTIAKRWNGTAWVDLT